MLQIPIYYIKKFKILILKIKTMKVVPMLLPMLYFNKITYKFKIFKRLFLFLLLSINRK